MEPLEVTFVVEGWPPVKNEARSLFARDHTHADRVTELLRAARQAVEGRGEAPFGIRAIGLELSLVSPKEPSADATNFLGGVADVLEVKARRGMLEHLGELANVGLYENDRQIQEVHYNWRQGSELRYVVRLWQLPGRPS